jgi:hypothetical protein
MRVDVAETRDEKAKLDREQPEGNAAFDWCMRTSTTSYRTAQRR